MTFFFTLLDDSSRPLGSRDPLGIEYVWSTVGRELVGNLTTITSHLDNFVFSLLGYHLCRDAVRGVADWDLFQRFEQLTSRARVANGSKSGVLGIDRIKRSSNDPIMLGISRAAMILSNQRQAGLWGLYTTALIGAKLLREDRTTTESGRQLAEAFLKDAPNRSWQIALNKSEQNVSPEVFKAVREWVDHLLKKTTKHQYTLAKALLQIEDSPTDKQRAMYEAGESFLKSDQPRKERTFIQWLASESPILSDYAQRVLLLDNALVLASTTFSWLLGNHGKAKSVVCSELGGQMQHWPYQDPLVPDFSREIDNPGWHSRARGLERFCSHMEASDWEMAIDRLLEHHQTVMASRGGVPWCTWEGDQLKVMLRTNPGTLPAGSEISPDAFEGWMQNQTFGYFLWSFLAILQQSGLVKGAS